MTEQQLLERLENLVDRTSLKAVVGALSAMCAEKSEHIGANWQDRELAHCWLGNANRLGKLADKITV